MLCFMQRFPEIGTRTLQAFQDNGILMTSFPDRVMEVQRHISLDVEVVAYNIGGLKANEHDREVVVSNIFFY